MEKTSKILVLGHKGLVGSALLKELKNQEYLNVITISKSQADLTNYKETVSALKYHSPEYVVNAAGKSGGIHANDTQSGDFIRENLQISTNVIEACRQTESVKKMAFIASSCVYPINLRQPISEKRFAIGELEPTTEGYAIANIAAIKMCQMYNKQYGSNFISIIAPNLYGENDNFNMYNSHVIPGIISRIDRAKINDSKFVILWGNGLSKREFLHTNDMAKAVLFLMNNYDNPEIINIGSGEDIHINELAFLIKKTIGYKGEIEWNHTSKNGVIKRRLDVKKINDLGWKAETKLSEGIKSTYEWYLNNYNTIRNK